MKKDFKDPDQSRLVSTEAVDEVKTDEVPVAQSPFAKRVEEEREEDLDSNSIYQQFLESKKKIEAQKNRMFGRGSAGAMSDHTAEFLENNNKVDAGVDVNDLGRVAPESERIIDELKQKDEIKNDLSQGIGLTQGVDNNSENIVSENIFSGSDFVPKKDEVFESDKKTSENLNSEQDGLDNKADYYNPNNKDNHSFGSFSI